MTLDEAIEYYINVATQRAVADEGMGENDKWNETKFMTKKESEQIIADNRQLAEWLKELKEAKRLLKAAVEDITGMQFGNECKVCIKKLLPECPIRNSKSCILGRSFKWRYADEALALIGEEGGNNA